MSISSATSGQGRKECSGRCVVAKGFADVREAIHVARAEDKSATELEGVRAKLVLMVTGFAGSFASDGVVFSEKVEQIGGLQVRDTIGLAQFVNEERELDASFFAEDARVVAVTQTNRGKGGAFVTKLLLVLAQLRDVFAAKDSAVMAQKDEHGGPLRPERP